MNGEPKPVVTGYPAAAQPSYSAASSASAAAAPAYGSAYPYVAPNPPFYPPPPPPGPYHYPNAGHGHRNSLFLRRLIILCISIFLIFAVVTFIIWLVLRFRVPDITVISASVSSFKVSDSQQVTGDFNLTFSVRNPNGKMGIFYDRIDAGVFYGSESISQTSLPPFYQEKENSTTIGALFSAVATYVNPYIVDSINKERSSSGVVTFDVRMVAVVRFKSGAWMTRRHVIRALCDQVRIAFSNSTSASGSLQGSPASCRVEM